MLDFELLIDTEDVTVMNDGSDGSDGATAVVRARGVLGRGSVLDAR